MKTWTFAVSIASALFFAFACANDDQVGSGNTGGAGGVGASGGEDGNPAETGGTPAGGGEAGGAGGVEAGGASGAPPVTCEPPEPPGGARDNAGGAAGAAGAANSGGGAGGAIASGLAIEGKYADEFDGHYRVTSSAWSGANAVFHIAAFDNTGHWLVARNDQANMYNPCLWSRFDWTEADGALYYCMTAYAAVSEEAARATPPADASDPATSGCGTFPWSKLTPE